jgi:hypothetical protein
MTCPPLSLLLLVFAPAEVTAIDPFLLVLTKFLRVFECDVFHIGGLFKTAAISFRMPFLAAIGSYEAPTFSSDLWNLLVSRKSCKRECYAED